MRVGRFTKAKKNRLALARDVCKWAGELLELVQRLDRAEPAMPSPVPPLESYASRKTGKDYGKVTVEPEAFSTVEGPPSW